MLDVSCMGYVSQSIPLALSKATPSLRVVLAPSEEAIEAVRVVSKGVAQRLRERPLAVAVLDHKLLARWVVPIGRTAGVEPLSQGGVGRLYG